MESTRTKANAKKIKEAIKFLNEHEWYTSRGMKPRTNHVLLVINILKELSK